MATISNLFIDQDADFTTTVTVNDSNGSALDLTSYTALAMFENRINHQLRLRLLLHSFLHEPQVKSQFH